MFRARLVRAAALTLFFAGCGASKHRPIGNEAAPPFDYPPILDDENAAAATSGGEWPERSELAASPAVVEDALAEVMGCPVVFEPALRGRWYALSGEDYYVDEEGRPAAARTRLPPLLADPRDDHCQG